MTDKKQNQVDDVEAMIGEGPVVEIEGTTYRMRRLGIADTFKLARIIAIGAAGIGKEIGNQEMSPELFGTLFLCGFPYAERQVFEFLSSIIGVEENELKDPVKFPMGSEVIIVNALAEHIDVKSFFNSVKSLLKTRSFQGLLKKTSTSSKKGTAGKTK
jgi:hypothetical protein